MQNSVTFFKWYIFAAFVKIFIQREMYCCIYRTSIYNFLSSAANTEIYVNKRLFVL